MIVAGKVIPLERVAALNFEGISESKLGTSLMGKGAVHEGEDFCDMGFRHNREMYICGYNSFIQVSNFRNIIDCLSDIVNASLLYFIFDGSISIATLGYSFIIYSFFSLIEIMSLKRNGFALLIDIFIGIANAGLEVAILYGFLNQEDYLKYLILGYLVLTFLTFIYVRLFQRRYNKVKIAAKIRTLEPASCGSFHSCRSA